MAAVVLTLALSSIVAGALWLLIGARLALDPDPRQNDIFNLLVYGGLAMVVVLPVVFFLIERL